MSISDKSHRILYPTLTTDDGSCGYPAAVAAVAHALRYYGREVKRDALANLNTEDICQLLSFYFDTDGSLFPYSLSDALLAIGVMSGEGLDAIFSGERLEQVMHIRCNVGIGDQSSAVVSKSVAQTTWSIKGVLASGMPVLAGIAITASWDDVASIALGRVRMPHGDEHVTDGNVVTIVGWDDRTEVFEFAYSEGEAFGNNGFGAIPYEYITDHRWCFELAAIAAV